MVPLIGIIGIGMPYSGKSTHLGRFARDNNYTYYDVGEMLRHEINIQTPVGVRAAGFLVRGKLCPDELVHDLVYPRLRTHAAARKPFIIVGLPRDEYQAEVLEQFVEKQGCTLVGVHIDITLDECYDRFHRGREGSPRPDDSSLAKLKVRLAEYSRAQAAIPTLRSYCIEFLTISGTARTRDDVYCEVSSRISRTLHDLGHIGPELPHRTAPFQVPAPTTTQPQP